MSVLILYLEKTRIRVVNDSYCVYDHEACVCASKMSNEKFFGVCILVSIVCLVILVRENLMFMYIEWNYCFI